MKRSFIQKLIGKHLEDAEAIIEANHLLCYSVPETYSAALVLKKDTVILWYEVEKLIVIEAIDGSGEPLEND